jgi:hypothetical protein
MPRSRRLVAFALRLPALALPLLGGCASGLDLGRATTLDPGVSRTSVGFEASFSSAGVGENRSAPLPWIQLAGGYHRGLTERVEVGGRAWAFGWPGAFTTFGLAADTKIQLHRSTFAGDPNLATGLSVTWHRPSLGGEPWTVLGATVPLLVGFDTKNGGQVVIGPRVAGWYGTSWGQRPIWTGAAGLGLGWALHVRHHEVFPEFTWMYCPLGWDGTTHDPSRAGTQAAELGVTFSFGRSYGH